MSRRTPQPAASGHRVGASPQRERPRIQAEESARRNTTEEAVEHSKSSTTVSGCPLHTENGLQQMSRRTLQPAASDHRVSASPQRKRPRIQAEETARRNTTETAVEHSKSSTPISSSPLNKSLSHPGLKLGPEKRGRCQDCTAETSNFTPAGSQRPVASLKNAKDFSTAKKKVCTKTANLVKKLDGPSFCRNLEGANRGRLSASGHQSAVAEIGAKLATVTAERDLLTVKLIEGGAEQLEMLQQTLGAVAKRLADIPYTSATLLEVEKSLKKQVVSLTKDKEQLLRLATDLGDKVADQESQIKASEQRQGRRSINMDNKFLVFCRVRPLLPAEDNAHQPFFTLRDDKTIDVHDMSPGNQEERVLTVSFDRIFSAVESQADVYADISQLVKNALDGRRVCIIAYGHSGTGKTYTMEGGDDNIRRGIIPRAIQQVFAASQSDSCWNYSMVASIVEVYNETLRDLLIPPSRTAKAADLPFKMTTRDGLVSVVNLTQVPVKSFQHFTQLLQRARKNRAVAATKFPERTSRSHSVFRLEITSLNVSTGLACRGLISMVDMAGSERLCECKNDGGSLQKTKNVDRSLVNMRNVLNALSRRSRYVPYRNSKLTHILMDCLGGNSKALVVLNILPREESKEETANTLRFASTITQRQIENALMNRGEQ